MRALIVGCGYVGTALGAELARKGHEVFGLKRNVDSQGELKALGIAPLNGDITKRNDLAKLPADYDWVVNCVSSARGNVQDYRAVYLEATQNLIAWLSGSPVKKFVYTSSTSVFGQTDGSIVTEQSPTEPVAETSRILVETEKTLLQAAAANFPAVILRVAGIYGPDRGYWLQQFLRGEARIEGKGERHLNMIHRDDVVGAIIAALEQARQGEIYNIVDDEPVTQFNLLHWLAATLRKELPPMIEQDYQGERKRGITNKRISNAKLKAKLGYQFKYATFREGYAAIIGTVNRIQNSDRLKKPF